MKYITLLITVPLTLFAVVFAIFNAQSVKVTFLPFDGFSFSLPVSVLALGLLGAGFLSGALFVWLYSQKLRWRCWRETRRADRLEKDLAALTEKKTQADTADDLPRLGKAS